MSYHLYVLLFICPIIYLSYHHSTIVCIYFKFILFIEIVLQYLTYLFFIQYNRIHKGNITQGEHYTRGTLHKGNITQGEHYTSETLHRGNITQGEHYTGGTLHRGNITQGEHYTRGTLHKGNIIQGEHYTRGT